MAPVTVSPIPATPLFFPFRVMQQAVDYWIDACQRSILFADVLRQRSNAHIDHEKDKSPSVLYFENEVILDGRNMAHPVNYHLLRIKPPEGIATDPAKRPFIVFDPRAGHGPGIGGMKHDSEIGNTLRAGHPCYFVAFTPRPVPTQTVEHVNEAEAIFVSKVVELHPAAPKPCLIGNCQAGWQISMMASIYPELVGVLIMAGAPVSYWAGVHGKNPMRYKGGLIGGAWTASLASDLGSGLFDGASLIKNFEDMNPSNTYWKKAHNLYAKIDTETQRFLEFERWWGSPIMLTGEEIKFIADDLFIGNRLSTAQVSTSEGLRVDLRNIKAPIICFASHGDDITPPQQALGWITDIYRSDEEIVATGQTIIYNLHDSIGHLGIFVSSTVATKEHDKFIQNIDLIESLPPGLYEAVFIEKGADTANPGLASGDHVLRFVPRKLDDIRALGGNDDVDERCFAAAARVSDNLKGVYETYISPMVRAATSEVTAKLLRDTQPIRVRYSMYSDRNPLLSGIGRIADYVKDNRRPVARENMFWQMQEMISKQVVSSFDMYRDIRDSLTEHMFFSIYGSPLLQASVGLRNSRPFSKRMARRDVDRERGIQQRIQSLSQMATIGGIREATVRALFYVVRASQGIDERGFRMFRSLCKDSKSLNMSMAEYKSLLKAQAAFLIIDEAHAMETISVLLDNATPEEEAEALSIIHKVIEARGEPTPEMRRRLSKLEKYFTAAHTSFHRRASDVQVFGE